MNAQNSFNWKMSGLVRQKVEVDHFPGDRDSVYIRISFPFRSYIEALADKENEQGISTARLPALLSPLKTDKALKAVRLAPFLPGGQRA